MPIDDRDDPKLKLRPPIPAQNTPVIAPPQMAEMKAAVNLPGLSIPSPEAEEAPPNVALPADKMPSLIPPSMPRMQTQKEADIGELGRLKQTGSGVHQFGENHHIAGPLLKTLDILGSVFAPNLARNIPGTTMHHNMLVNQQTGRVNADLEQEKDQAQATRANAETNKILNPPVQEPNTPFELYHKQNPTATLEDFNKANTADKDVKKPAPIIHESDQGIFMIDPETRAVTPLTFNGKPLMPKGAGKLDSPEQQFVDEYQKKNPGASIADAQKAYVANNQAPQHDQRQLAVVGDKVVELKPGMTVAPGTKTMSGELAGPKVSADEQKRADLVENLNENLDQLEDIVKRRPELFGPIAGRTTKLKEAIGSDDPDVAALKGIEDRLGMVQQSSHGMRSAQHVAQSADSILNGFKNGDKAMLRAISDARKSGATFTADVQNKQGAASAGSEVHEEYVRDPKTGKLVLKK